MFKLIVRILKLIVFSTFKRFT